MCGNTSQMTAVAVSKEQFAQMLQRIWGLGSGVGGQWPRQQMIGNSAYGLGSTAPAIPPKCKWRSKTDADGGAKVRHLIHL